MINSTHLKLSRQIKLLSVFFILTQISFAQMIGGRQNNQPSVKEVKASALNKGASSSDVNLFTGAMSTSYTLGTVSTPAGLSFTLTSSYSSTFTAGGEATISSGIPYGEGWSLNIPSITITTESFSKYSDADRSTASMNANDANYIDFTKAEACAEGKLVWFEPQINIPGVISERFVYKYTDPQTGGHVFVPSKFDKYMEAVFYNGGSWDVKLDDGTKYYFSTRMIGFRQPSNQRVNKDGLTDLTKEPAVIDQQLLPKEEFMTFFCNRIGNPNLRNDQYIVFQYEQFGKFNYFKEYSDLMLRLRAVLGKELIKKLGAELLPGADDPNLQWVTTPEKRIPNYEAYKDILLTKVESQNGETGYLEELVLDYKTINAPNAKDMLQICQSGVNRLDSLYNFKTVWSEGIDNANEAALIGSDVLNTTSNNTCGNPYGIIGNSNFSSWWRYNHGKSDQAISNYQRNNTNINILENNPYKVIGSNGCGVDNIEYNRNKVGVVDMIPFNHAFLESPRIGTNFPPGDIYEVKTLIYNPYAGNMNTMPKAFCNFDINIVSGDNTSPLAQADIANQNSNSKTVCAYDADSRRYHTVFSTFNQALKWNSAGAANGNNANDVYMKTSNLFVMPNLPNEFGGFHVQIGPGNSDTKFDTDYNQDNNYLPIGNAKSQYYNFKFNNTGFNPVNNIGLEPCEPMPNNFGIGMPWYMTDYIWGEVDNKVTTPYQDRYKFWWFDKTYGVAYNNQLYMNRPTSADENVKLMGMEMVRYSKNPYMLCSVKEYKTNGANNNNDQVSGRILVNQLNFEYEVRVDEMLNNRAFYKSGVTTSFYSPTSKHWYRNVFLLKKIIQIPTNSSVNQPQIATNISTLPTTQFSYAYQVFTDPMGTNSNTSIPFIHGFYCINKIVDQLGGETNYEFYPVNDMNYTMWTNMRNWDLKSSQFGSSSYTSINYANPSANQNVFKIQLAVKKKTLSSPTGSTFAKEWLYDYSNPVSKLGITSINRTAYPFGNNYKVTNSNIENGFAQTTIWQPIVDVNSKRIYEVYEHYTSENNYLTWGKLKSTKNYDASNNLMSQQNFEYTTSLAFDNGMYRENPVILKNTDPSEYSAISLSAMQANKFNSNIDTKLVDGIFTCYSLEYTNPEYFSALDNTYLNSYFVRLSKETKTEYDLYVKNSVVGLTGDNVSPVQNSSLRLMSSNILTKNVSQQNNSTIRLSQPKETVPFTSISMSTITEYEYWDADHLGYTSSNGYKKLAGYSNEQLHFEPSWQIFRKKTYSPDFPDAYSKEENYYYYDLINDFVNFDNYDLLHFGEGSGGAFASSSFPTLFFLAKHKVRNIPYEKRTITKAPCQDPIAVSEYYIYDHKWEYDYVLTDLVPNVSYYSGSNTNCAATDPVTPVSPTPPKPPCILISKNVTGREIGSNDPCFYNVYYNNDHYQCPCKESPSNNPNDNPTGREIMSLITDKVMLRYIVKQIDTVRIDNGYMNFYSNYNKGISSSDILRFQSIPSPQANTPNIVKPLFPFDTVLVRYIDKREANGLIELEHDAKNLFTEYQYSRPKLFELKDLVHPCNNSSWVELFNVGVPQAIVVGKGLPDSLVTYYTYNPDFTVKNIVDPNGTVVKYEYDEYSRLNKAYRNGSLLTINKYNQFSNNLNSTFESRAAENYVESFILLDSSAALSNIAEHSRAYSDPLGRKLDILSQISSNYNSTNTSLLYSNSTIHSGLSIYDNWDRVIKQYKPFIQNTSTPTVFQPLYNNLNEPYAEDIYENNKRSKVIRASKFGEDIMTGHTVNSNYHIISGNDLLSELGEFTPLNDAELVCNPITNKFIKEVVVDEDGKKVVSYTNPFGQKVATKSYISNIETAVTLYYYDSKGNMKKVKNPLGQQNIYKYNLLGLMYSRQTADAGRTNYMYDNTGKLVLEQDASALSAEGNNNIPYVRKYTYDIYGRLIRQERLNLFTNRANPMAYYTGAWFNHYSNSPFSYSTTLDSHFTWFEVSSQNGVNIKSPVNVYSWFNSPVVEKEWFYGNTQPQILNDGIYEDKIVNFINAIPKSHPFNIQSNLKGRLAQTRSYDNDGTLKVINLYAYNKEGLLKWEITQFNNESNKISSIIKYPYYNLRNSLKTQIIDAGFDGDDIRYDYVYDGWNRIIETKVNQNKIATFNYNDALSLIQKINYFTTCSNGSSIPIDTISYTYDNRDRLTKLSSHLYNENLYYDDQHPQTGVTNASKVNASFNFNGNINATSHTIYTDRTTNGSLIGGLMDGATIYGYEYDGINRLTNADASIMNVVSTNLQSPTAASRYGDESYVYDKIGNILNLKRGIYYNPQTINPSNWVQNWNYNYQQGTNKLLQIDSNGIGLRNYSYDNNGNLKTDSYKKLNQTIHARSNLPQSIVLGNSGMKQIIWEYQYDANDNRVYKKNSTENKDEEYTLVGRNGKILGSLAIANNEWKWYIYANNRMAEIRNTNIKYYEFDHLGSTRATYTVNSPSCNPKIVNYILEACYDFYSYGKVLRCFKSTKNEKFQYTGKERDEEYNVDYFGARNYDDEIVRWNSVDPLSDKYLSYSPYIYAADNPLYFNDPDGRDLNPVGLKQTSFEGTYDDLLKNNSVFNQLIQSYKQKNVNLNLYISNNVPKGKDAFTQHGETSWTQNPKTGSPVINKVETDIRFTWKSVGGFSLERTALMLHETIHAFVATTSPSKSSGSDVDHTKWDDYINKMQEALTEYSTDNKLNLSKNQIIDLSIVHAGKGTKIYDEYIQKMAILNDSTVEKEDEELQIRVLTTCAEAEKKLKKQ